jgi:tRNA-intron endonuclease
MEKIQSYLSRDIISSNSQEAFNLHDKSSFGKVIGEKVQYSFSEVLFLVEKEKMEVLSNKKVVLFKDLLKKLQKIDKRIQIKYIVFKDLREKGYIIKTALKFGADFRVYEKGFRMDEKHSKWIVFVDHESRKLTWHEFSAKNRVAHSTKKNLLLSIVDDEGDVSYYEIKWIKP